MVTNMETEEMKKKNEEILERWRSLGLLDGLTKGSINEWRCAKSFDDMANYLINNDCESCLTVLAFPMIRKAICTGKKRLHRLIEPKEIIDFFNTATPNECFDYVVKNSNRKGEAKVLVRTLFKNLLDYENCGEETLTSFFANISSKTAEPYKTIIAITKGIFDWEAEILAIATDLFVERCINKTQKEG